MMKVRSTSMAGPKEVVATFGKSTYVEPFLSREAIQGLILVRDAMPEVWVEVDSSTIAIMERAVIMCG